MSEYPLTWITDSLAVGHAPMSYAELDSIREQGIAAIVNLCGEYCDLHEIEESAGFEVFFLPIPDETAPRMEDMESGLAWLDEAVYLGKKVLVHCRHGIGRTGTFVTAYLLRRGFNLKKAGRLLKKTETRANPTNFSQWWLLRKYGKKEGQLTIHEPDPQNRRHDELAPFFGRYELLIDAIERNASTDPRACSDISHCTDGDPAEIELIEALYLHTKANVTLSLEKRNEMMTGGDGSRSACALFDGPDGPLYRFRPAGCRLRETDLDAEFAERIKKELAQLSREVFAEIFSVETDIPPPPVPITDVVSGRFIQTYFQLLAVRKADHPNDRPGSDHS